MAETLVEQEITKLRKMRITKNCCITERNTFPICLGPSVNSHCKNTNIQWTIKFLYR